MSEATDRIKQGVSQAQNAATELSGKIASKAGEVGQSVRDAAGSAATTASDKFGQVSDQARNAYGKGQAALSEWEEDLEGMIEDRPVIALLVAAAIGLLLGVLLSGRRSK